MIPVVTSAAWIEVVYGLGILGLFTITRPAYLAFRRRRSSYGTVFNTDTGKPEALVAINLRDLHGSVVCSAVTDREGRYRIVAPKGDFMVEVRKFGFTYPSTVVKGKQFYEHENILNVPHIIVNEYGALVKNIPIDPQAGQHASFRVPRIHLPKQLSFSLFGLSPFAAVALAFWMNSISGWVLCGITCAWFLRRFISFNLANPPFGTIRDSESGYPIEGVVARVMDQKFNKVLETQITSPKGRYAFVVNRGSYRILLKKPGYKSVILNFNGIVTDGHLLAKDVAMKTES